MTQKYSFHTRFLINTTALLLLFHAPLLAEEEEYPNNLSQLMSRLDALEEENRGLRGQLEETQHQLSTLNKQVDTLSADIDYRLSNAESNSMPLPLPPSSPTIEKTASSASGEDDGYEKARSLLEQGDYEAAERAFASFVASNPKDKRAGAAQYWLGMTFFVRGEHDKAVAAFAKGYKNYPKSEKAGDNLLKLAKSLCALDRKADACTTLDQLSTEHPKFSPKNVADEKKKLNCK